MIRFGASQIVLGDAPTRKMVVGWVRRHDGGFLVLRIKGAKVAGESDSGVLEIFSVFLAVSGL